MEISQNPLDLSGRRVVVTGAASGIGRATCELLSRVGARVVGIDADVGRLGQVIEGLTGSGHDSRHFDLRELGGISGLLTDIAGKGGLLHGVVHAAGLSCIYPIRLLDPARYRDVLTVNAEAALGIARAFQGKRVCDPFGGSVVFVSSVMALTGSPGGTAYGMTKGALTGLTKSLAIELAPRKIRVNCVAPGFVKTAMFEKTSAPWDVEQSRAVEAKHPLGFGEAVDVAHSILFLLADTGRWITGSVLVVDGGYTAQ